MIRIASEPNPATPVWHEVFLKMVPAIETHARISFRHLRGEARAEAIQNVLCIACTAVARLAELDKLDLCYATVMARFAVAQTRDGRMPGRALNCKDVSSTYCQRRKGIVMEGLDKYDVDEDSWQEIVIEDRHCGPFDVVRTKLDFSDWLKSLRRRDRRIAESLALGNRTTDVARRFKVCVGRVSQLRRELAESWHRFVGDEPVPAVA